MIYIVTHYYLPLGNPPATRMGQLAKALINKYGSENIKVITGRPNYPDGILPKELRWRFFHKGIGKHNEQIRHLYEFPAPFRGVIRKTISYFSFASSAFGYFVFKRFKPDDIILVTSGPVFPAYVIYLLSRFKKNMRYIIDVRDLSPQTVIGMGFMNQRSPIYKLLKWLSDHTYRAAVASIGVVPEICQYLNSARNSNDSHYIPNPVETELFKPLSSDKIQEFKNLNIEIFGNPDRTVFIYSGVFSVYIDLMTLMRALNILQQRNKNFIFILIGYGEDEDKLKEFVEINNLSQFVIFIPHMSRQNLVNFICASDICYTSVSNDPIFEMVIPTKVKEYLACGKFVVGVQKGPFAKILQEKQLSLLSDPGNPEDLSHNLDKVINHRDDYILSPNARSFVIDNFSFEQFERDMTSLFSKKDA